MNSIWVPVPVALFLRRVVNVLSTASITHHYLLHRRDEQPLASNTNGAQAALRHIQSFWWPEGRLHEELAPAWSSEAIVRGGQHENVVKAIGISLPWLRWSWPSAPRLSIFRRTAEVRDDLEVREPEHRASNATEAPQSPPEDNDPLPENLDTIHRLMHNPVLYDPVHAPRYPIVLCHGLYGFDVRGPSAFPRFRMHYWSSILNILRKTVGAEVIVTSVPGTGSIASRSQELDRFLQQNARGRGINLMAHSMGGLDCRHLITHVQPTAYTPLSLTSIATPHRGSAFMDWCTEYLGLGRAKTEMEKQAVAATAALQASSYRDVPPPDPTSSAKSPSSPLSISSLPSSFTTLLLSAFDSPAYANLTTTYLNTVFNPSTPDDPRVKYFSVAGRTRAMNVWHPLWLPKLVLDSAEEKDRKRLQLEASSALSTDTPPPWAREELWGNDGLVTVQSARWGEFLGTLDACDHWEIRGASGIEMGVDLPSVVGEGWGLSDWGRFVKALGRLERRAEAKEARKHPDADDEVKQIKQFARDKASYEALKSSTDRLSSVVDWIVDQVPVDALPSLPFTGGSKAATKTAEAAVKELAKKKQLQQKLDLERLYVALTRKLYEEGL